MVADFKLDPLDLPQLTPDQAARLDSMTDAEMTAAAESDPDNPPLTDDEIERFRAARAAKRARRRVGLTQREFADRFWFSHGRLRDIEGARGKRGDSALIAYLAIIEHDPDAVAGVLARLKDAGDRGAASPPRANKQK